jgi:uncharacterized protein
MTEETVVSVGVPELSTLDPRAKTAWRLQWGLLATAVLAVLIGAAVLLNSRSHRDILPWLSIALVLAVVLAVVVVWFAPLLEWRSWQYAIRDDEVEIRSGIWDKTRALIPMSRVQYVDFRQGPVDRWLGLATIVIATAGGAREIPGIAARAAEPLRNRIAALANIHDDL